MRHAVGQLLTSRYPSRDGKVGELFAGWRACTCGWVPVGGGWRVGLALGFDDSEQLSVSQNRAVKLHVAVHNSRDASFISGA